MGKSRRREILARLRRQSLESETLLEAQGERAAEAMMKPPGYPFSAIVGQNEMKLALLLASVDWRLACC